MTAQLRMFAAAQDAAPEYWETTLAALEERLPDGAAEDGWSAARDRMARLHPEAHLAAGLAAAAVPAAAACSLLAASRPTADGAREALDEVLWRDVGDLVDRITEAEHA